MAFQNVNVSNTKKTTAMDVGASLIGYVVRFEDSRMGEGQKNIVMQDEGGEQYVLFTSGNIRYMINDNKIQAGLLTKITRLEDKVIKGKKASQFAVEQDPEKTLESAIFGTTTAAKAGGVGKTTLKAHTAG
jgi:hypothetical protein